ncbi:hypothetical protein EV130_1204 [Rhizobium azibense]|uniref:Uncharacterized protein n=1 Tax=Rhizobium azibense TaxID=1136135 RepID=A0A4R3Q3A6_9HYPH|nr:hypothetical protein [Rhizobium azibense]TCU15620.1 hypothetical protein EV130_1204 [Rhizobium azibense]
MTLNQVLANPLEWETPAARLRQIAMPRVAEMTRLGRGAIRQTVGLLAQRGLLIKGYGENFDEARHAWQFDLSPTFLHTRFLMMGSPIGHGE